MRSHTDYVLWSLQGAPSSDPVMQSVANKNMDSRKAHYGVMQSNKH